MPLEIQSISPSGLAVLTADNAPSGLLQNPLGDLDQETESLTFLLEKDGRSITLQANLVWLELTDEKAKGRMELIVDTSNEPGWWEVHTAFTQE